MYSPSGYLATASLFTDTGFILTVISCELALPAVKSGLKEAWFLYKFALVSNMEVSLTCRWICKPKIQVQLLPAVKMLVKPISSFSSLWELIFHTSFSLLLLPYCTLSYVLLPRIVWIKSLRILYPLYPISFKGMGLWMKHLLYNYNISINRKYLTRIKCFQS